VLRSLLFRWICLRQIPRKSESSGSIQGSEKPHDPQGKPISIYTILDRIWLESFGIPLASKEQNDPPIKPVVLNVLSLSGGSLCFLPKTSPFLDHNAPALGLELFDNAARRPRSHQTLGEPHKSGIRR
jgi:hypothetical protein